MIDPIFIELLRGNLDASKKFDCSDDWLIEHRKEIAAFALALYDREITLAEQHEPDPTPALGWKAMQTAAAEAVAKEAHGETVLGGQRFKTAKLEDAVEAILALPSPTDAQLLAEAVRLPEVQELVKASKWVGFAAQTSGGTAGRDLALIAAIDVLAAALAKIGGAA